MAGIFGLTWLTTRFLSRRLPGGGRGGNMQVIEKLTLGKDRQIALVKVGDEHFMVGLAGQNISFSQAIRLDAVGDLQPQGSARPGPAASAAARKGEA